MTIKNYSNVSSTGDDAIDEPGLALLESQVAQIDSLDDSPELPRANRPLIKMVAIAFTAALSAAEPRRIGISAATSSTQIMGPSSAIYAATDQQATVIKMREQVRRIVEKAVQEEFAEGITSEFAKDIATLVEDFGRPAFDELQRVIGARSTPPHIGFETLTSVAKLDASSLASDRLRLIEWGLTSEVPEVRYGAAFGLATIREPAAEPSLRTAIQRETIPELRRFFERILSGLSED